MGVEILESLQRIAGKIVAYRRWLASAALASVAACIFAHAMMGNNGWLSYREKKAEYIRLQQEIQTLDQDNQRLDGEIKALKSDPKAIEKEAREQLRYVRPGEVVVLLPDQKPSQPVQGDQQARKK